ncbi:META domain-containing protein [Emticicia sp. SJ17W-69]|uniref:META domain-containing protein n=1 Tax=Emticicia sp. SJ17W-69 TaxID=3421657 RepID=UPI003EBA3EF0
MKNLTITLIISSLLMMACGKESVEAANPNLSALSTSGLLGQWKFKGYADGKVPAYDVTLEFKDEEGKNTLNGRSSVNFYFATFETNDATKTMTISTIGSTKIAGTPEANQFEMVYYERLRNVAHYELKTNNTLLLYLSNPAKEVMYFERK